MYLSKYTPLTLQRYEKFNSYTNCFSQQPISFSESRQKTGLSFGGFDLFSYLRRRKHKPINL